MRRLAVTVLLLTMAFSVQAELPACTSYIADYYGLPEGALQAIHEIEGGQIGMEVRNNDGSYDRGLMQINTFWDESLARFGIDDDEVKNNGCTNVAIGAWILRQEVDRFGNWKDAFAAYNAGAGNLPAGRGYAQKVMAVWRRSIGRTRDERIVRQSVATR